MFSFEEHVCLFDILFRLEWHDWRARAVYCMVQSYAGAESNEGINDRKLSLVYLNTTLTSFLKF